MLTFVKENICREIIEHSLDERQMIPFLRNSQDVIQCSQMNLSNSFVLISKVIFVDVHHHSSNFQALGYYCVCIICMLRTILTVVTLLLYLSIKSIVYLFAYYQGHFRCLQKSNTFTIVLLFVPFVLQQICGLACFIPPPSP